MGNFKTPDEPGHQSPSNGYDDVYGAPHWSNYIINKRPQNAITKRAVVFLSIDLVALWIVLGILKNLSDAKQIIALIVGIWYLSGRALIIWVKIIAFIGKNSDNIKKGWQSLKDMFGA